MRRSSIALAAAAALGAGQATVQAAPKDQPQQQCFRTSDIDNSVQATETQLNLKTRDNRYFQILTTGACFTTLGIDPYVLKIRGGADLICQPIDVDLSAGPPGFQTPCIVDKIVPLTKAQVMALPKRQQP
jgi:hypothetical protein